MRAVKVRQDFKVAYVVAQYRLEMLSYPVIVGPRKRTGLDHRIRGLYRRFPHASTHDSQHRSPRGYIVGACPPALRASILMAYDDGRAG